MQKAILISAIALFVLAIAGFAGGAVTYAELSDTETADVSVEAGTWTTTPAENDTTTENQSVGATDVQPTEGTTEVDANDSTATPTAVPTETTTEPSTTAESTTESTTAATETAEPTDTQTETADATTVEATTDAPETTTTTRSSTETTVEPATAWTT